MSVDEKAIDKICAGKDITFRTGVEVIDEAINVLTESAEYFKGADCDVRAHECHEAAAKLDKLYTQLAKSPEQPGAANATAAQESRAAHTGQPDEYTAFQNALKEWGKPDDEFGSYHCDSGNLYALWGRAVEWARANVRESVKQESLGPKHGCTVLADKCPECGNRMIENSSYIECGEMDCNYIRTIK